MAYKDQEKQKEANRQAQARFRAKGITELGITNQKIANKVIPNTRRGKDIKCFEDLHPEIQANIRRISDTNEEFKRRTAMAIHYQHIFPERYEPQGAVCAGD